MVDVLFTDIQLNDTINGWEVAEAFRAKRGNILVRSSRRGALLAACISTSPIGRRIF
jgi:hypothetical protein